jgi:hypothetical protein
VVIAKDSFAALLFGVKVDRAVLGKLGMADVTTAPVAVATTASSASHIAAV